MNQTPSYKVRCEQADFWADDGEDIIFSGLEEAIKAIKQFLVDTEESGLGYLPDDIEIVAEDDSVLLYQDLLDFPKASEQHLNSDSAYWAYVHAEVRSSTSDDAGTFRAGIYQL